MTPAPTPLLLCRRPGRDCAATAVGVSGPRAAVRFPAIGDGQLTTRSNRSPVRRALAGRACIDQERRPGVRHLLRRAGTRAGQRTTLGVAPALPPGEALDACLLAASGGLVGHRHRKLELDRQAAGCVAAGGSVTVAREPAFEIDRPACVESDPSRQRSRYTQASGIGPSLVGAPTSPTRRARGVTRGGMVRGRNDGHNSELFDLLS